jgi:hypothetical protein
MKTYQLNSKTGSLKLGYLDGYLNLIEMDFKEPLKSDKYDMLMMSLPQEETHLEGMKKLGFTISEEMATNQKVALFCRIYKEVHELPYKASRQDGGKLKNIKLTEELVKHYMHSDNFLFKGKHSVGNLVKYYNELLLDFKEKDEPVNRFPNKYDREFEKKLQGAEVSAYWAHLRKLGLKPKKTPSGIDWV